MVSSGLIAAAVLLLYGLLILLNMRSSFVNAEPLLTLPHSYWIFCLQHPTQVITFSAAVDGIPRMIFEKQLLHVTIWYREHKSANSATASHDHRWTFLTYLNTSRDSFTSEMISSSENGSFINLKWFTTTHGVSSTFEVRIVTTFYSSSSSRSNSSQFNSETFLKDSYLRSIVGFPSMMDDIMVYPNRSREDWFEIKYSPMPSGSLLRSLLDASEHNKGVTAPGYPVAHATDDRVINQMYQQTESSDSTLEFAETGLNYSQGGDRGDDDVDDDDSVVVLHQALLTAFIAGVQEQSQLRDKETLYARGGFSGHKFRHFMNNLGSMIPNMRYLEIGVFNGSSLCAVLHGNSNVRAVAIDSWQDGTLQIQDMKAMRKNVEAAVRVYNRSTTTRSARNAISATATEEESTSLHPVVHIIAEDCWQVELPDRVVHLLGDVPANVYFYDAGHSTQEQFNGVVHYLIAVADTFIFIVDDWNWQTVQLGTYSAIKALSLDIIQEIQVVTSGGSPGFVSSWHNGCGIFLLQKRRPVYIHS